MYVRLFVLQSPMCVHIAVGPRNGSNSSFKHSLQLQGGYALKLVFATMLAAVA
jgi:hypothetical protein